MKKICSIVIALVLVFSSANAQSKPEMAVAHAVEQLRKAMVDADSVMLDKLISSKLSYGHSGGRIEGKQEFIQNIVSGKSDFVTIELPEQTISTSKDIAVVRHKLNATTNDNDKPAEVHLAVLLIWQKQHGGWKLLARQAVKLL